MNKGFAKGILYASISSATYGLNPLFALPLFKSGMNVESVLAFRYLFGIILLALYIPLFKGGDFRLTKKELLPQIACGLMMSLSSLTLYTSYHYLDVAIASTLLYVYPIMVAVIMTTIFHEQMSPVTLACLLLSVLGVAVLNWSGGGRVSTAGVLIVLMSALTWAFYLIILRRTALRRKQAHIIAFYSLLFGLPLYLIKGWGTLRMPKTPGAWALVILMAALPTIVSISTSALAVQHVGPTITSIFGALEPLTAMLIGIFVFGEKFTTQLTIGFILIVGAVTFAALVPQERKTTGAKAR